MSASTSEFADTYLKTWTEPDTEKRHQNVRAVWATDGEMHISSIGATVKGVDKIIEHIDRVHEDVIAGKGVVFSYTQEVEAGDGLLLASSVAGPDGSPVGKGADVIFRSDDGKVTAAYMFMGLQ